jgi:hypothetical protein
VQAPNVWPGVMEQVSPRQQSPVVVQAPAEATQAVPVGGLARQRNTPWASGTHGVPPQHSAENWQRSPPAMQQGAWPV